MTLFSFDSKAEGKRCPDCRERRPLAEFSRNASRADGLQFYCKKCYASRSARYYRNRQAAVGRLVRERIPVPDGHKRCPQCEQIKPHAAWDRNHTTSDGYAAHCKSCRAVRSKSDHLKRAYGITLVDAEAILAEQGGVCAICQGPDPKHLDHDHETGEIRGFLCLNCNMGLGSFKDSPQLLDAAIGYLEDYVREEQMFITRRDGRRMDTG